MVIDSSRDFRTAADFIKNKIKTKPDYAVILGTGLNPLIEILTERIEIPYSIIPGFSVSTAPSHEGKLVSGKLHNRNILIMQGRMHYYEGYSMQEITFPIRVFRKMGITRLIVTNAAGSLKKYLNPGSIVILKDHLNFMGINPLIGKNLDEFGERFPSQNEPYDQQMRTLIDRIGYEKNITLAEGVYAGVSGPSMETRAECNMLKIFGADIVGMSTVPEVIVALHSGMSVLGISVVTNYTNLFHSKIHQQEEIRENAEKARGDMIVLLSEFIKKYQRK